ncbi:MAG: glycine betaine ABC transporter substrate-binding protein [Actinomycetota bacterium]|nr:glycine betaine ABC transporter substrate-binding protein [Actinomycetota bacterium]
MKRTNHSARHTTRALGAAGLAILALAGVACSKKTEDTTPVPQLMPRVAITSVKGDTQSQLMAAIYARVLENKGVRVTRKDPVDMDRAEYFQALQDGQFDMIPEFSRDLLKFVLDAVESGTTTVPTTATTDPAPATTRAPILMPTTTIATETTVPTTDTGSATTTADSSTTTTSSETTTTTVESTTTSTLVPTNERSVTAQLFAINGTIPTTLIAYEGSPAERRDVIGCSAATMKTLSLYQLFSLTDLASLAPQLRLGAPAAWIADDEAGLAVFEQYYAPEFADVVTVEAADIATAIADGTADCFVVDSFDPVITEQQLSLLFDDQYMLPNNSLIVLMSSTVNAPEVTDALNSLIGMLTTEKLNQMLREIEVNGTDVAVVANAFADNL